MMELETAGMGTLIAHYRAALAEVDRLRARVAELEAIEQRAQAIARNSIEPIAGAARYILGEEV